MPMPMMPSIPPMNNGGQVSGMELYYIISYCLVFILGAIYIADTWFEGIGTRKIRAQKTLLAILGILVAPITLICVTIYYSFKLFAMAFEKEEK